MKRKVNTVHILFSQIYSSRQIFWHFMFEMLLSKSILITYSKCSLMKYVVLFMIKKNIYCPTLLCRIKGQIRLDIAATTIFINYMLPL